MALNLGELKQWPPEIADLAQAAREAADNHTVSAEFYRSLIAVSTWEGQGAEAARSAMTATAADHEAVADHVGVAASRMQNVHRDAEVLAETIKRILDDAAAQPAVGIDESSNQVIPPDTSHMTEEYAAQVAARVTDLRERIADALADGERIDTELAGAITAASGERVMKTAGSLEEMLLPSAGERRHELKPDEQSSTPKDLDEALERIAEPSQPAQPVPLDPAKVEQFKNLARETMLRSGVPPEQIEQRLDAMVAAAQKPLAPVKSPERDAMPKPSFEDGFADGWFGTEESIKNLIGANGLEDLKESWTDLAKGTWERVTNPIDSMKEDIEHLTKYPGHYLGEVAGSTALTAPSAMVGGEAALAARSVSQLGDLATAGANTHSHVPDNLTHSTPTPDHSTTSTDHPTPHALPGAENPAPIGSPTSYSPHAVEIAAGLNDAFLQGNPTLDLAREVADLSTHRVGDADRVVLGAWDGQNGGYIGEARNNGGVYYDTGSDVWDSIGNGLDEVQVKSLGWQINEQFLRTQLASGIASIEYVLPDGFDNVEQVARVRRESFSAAEINFLKENAASYGYRQFGNSWVYEGGHR